MPKFSYSKVSTFEQCPYKFKLRYKDKLEPLTNYGPDNPLYEGTAVHEGIEKRSVEDAISCYKANYPVITKSHEIEILKIKEVLKKAIKDIPEGEYEHRLSCDDGFIGFIDCLVLNEDGTYNLLDFKFSNNVSRYKRSAQIHVYKYYFESLTGNKIKDMYYVMIPKYADADLNESLDMSDIKDRIKKYYKDKEITFEKISYSPQLVEKFFKEKEQMDSCKEFKKKPSKLCEWCDYFEYCSTNGKDTSKLMPKEVKISKPEPVSLF